MAETLIKNFKQISKADTKIAGGKGASLGEMTQAGIPVPNGFVILSNVFDKFLEKTNLNIEIDAVLSTVDIKEVHTIKNASKKIQARILSKEIPRDIKIEILRFYKNLNNKFVAIRSSATSEDSASAAWAGQLDSFLNTTKDTLLENIKKCWASLFTPRAIFYRFEKKLNKDTISVAVVVQKMIDSEESGIAFSVHPVTQDENQIIIEAGFGLGEAIVSGQITPDSYVVDKQEFTILDINVNEQAKALYEKAKGGNEWKELGEKGKKQVLTEKEIIELSKLIVKIEKHYGFPCDIEWAKEKGKFHITQSRPITTITKASKYNLVDKFIETTLNQELFPLVRNASIFAFRIGGYVEKNYYKASSSAPYIISAKDGESIAQVSETKLKEAGVEFFKKFLSDKSFLIKHKKEINKYLEKLNKLYAKCSYSYVEKEDVDKLASLAQKAFSINRHLNTLNWHTFYFNEAFCKELVNDSNFSISLKKLKQIYLKSTEPAFPSFEKRNYIHYLDLITNNCSNNKIAEDCQYFFANYSSVDGNLNSITKKLEKEFKKITPEKVKKIVSEETKVIIEKEKKFKHFLNSLSLDERKIVEYIQHLMWVRDIRKTATSLALTIIYRIAQRFFNIVGLPENLIMFYSSDEVEKGLQHLQKNKEKIKNRKNGFTMLYIVEDDNDPEFEYNTYEYTKNQLQQNSRAEMSKNTVIKGQIAYRGRVVGNAKIIFDPTKAKKLEKQDVLVTGMTRPEFIPLMKKVSAVITDEGGIACHAAIISRELKIPCIVGTKIATQLLKDGMKIEVDANKGVVRILKKK